LGKDNFCTFHQAPHSEKTFPQWLQNMTTVITQLLEDQTLGKVEDETGESGEDDPPLVRIPPPLC